MRKPLVTLFGAGLVTSLMLSACVVKEDAKDGSSDKGAAPGVGGAQSTGGSIVRTGGAPGRGGSSPRGGSTAASNGGTTTVAPATGGSDNGTSLADKCPNLLETLNPGAVGVCSTSNVEARFSQINVLVVLDKSGSMKQTPAGYTKTKWAGAVDSIGAALDPKQTLVNYGFMMFPQAGATTCEMADAEAAVNIPVGNAAEKVPAITQLMLATTPSGGTPTAQALKSALYYYTLGAGALLVGAKNVILVTDGGPNCNAALTCGPEACTANLDKNPAACGDTVANCCDIANQTDPSFNPQSLCVDELSVVDQIALLKSNDIKTYVIGIPGTEQYAASLDKFAQAGGAQVLGKPHQYYEVTGETGLTETFKAITTSLVHSCIVPLADPPKDLGNINVAIDCTPVPQTTGGVPNWHYDADQKAIVIEGTQCQRIETQGINRVDVVLGCPPFGMG
jgi:hypothetical protein